MSSGAARSSRSSGCRGFCSTRRTRSSGTFGTPPHFPHVGPVRLALEMYLQDGVEDLRNLALTALDAMGWGPLYDAVDGGFFRCAHGPGWQHPSYEKLLDVNSALLSLYADASEA